MKLEIQKIFLLTYANVRLDGLQAFGGFIMSNPNYFVNNLKVWQICPKMT